MEEVDGDNDALVASIVGAPRTTHLKYVGKIRTFGGLERCEVLFLLSAVVMLLVTVGFTSYSMYVTLHKEKDQEYFTFAVIILINTVFFFITIVSGIFLEKVWYLIFAIASLCLVCFYCVYDVINRLQRGDPMSTTWSKIVRMSLVIAGAIVAVASIIFIKFYERYPDRIAAIITLASDTHIRLYKTLNLFTCLLTIDLQVATSLLVLSLAQGFYLNTVESVTLFAGIPVVVIWIIIGYVAARLEKKKIMACFEVTGILFWIYIGYKCYILGQTGCSPRPTPQPVATTPYYCYRPELLVANAITVALYGLVKLAVLITGALVLRGFGRGLKDSLLETDRGFIEDCFHGPVNNAD